MHLFLFSCYLVDMFLSDITVSPRNESIMIERSGVCYKRSYKLNVVYLHLAEVNNETDVTLNLYTIHVTSRKIYTPTFLRSCDKKISEKEYG